MKLFKKFLLAAGLVGLIGTFGFASDAKAAGQIYKPEMDVDATIEGGTVVKWDPILIPVDPQQMPESAEDVLWDWDAQTMGNYEVTSAKITIGTGSNKIEVDIPKKDLDEWGGGSFDVEEYIENRGIDKSEYSGAVTVTLNYKYSYLEVPALADGSDWDYNQSEMKEFSGTSDPDDAGTITPFYLVTVKSADYSLGWVDVNGEDKKSAYSFYVKKNAATLPRVTAEAASGCEFLNWNNSITTAQLPLGNVTAPATYTANFRNNSEVSFNVRKYDTDGTTDLGSGTIKSSDTDAKKVTLYVGQYVEFSPNGDASMEWESETTRNKYLSQESTYRFKASAVGSARVHAKNSSGSVTTRWFTVEVVENPVITLTDYVDYITDGFTLEFKAKAASGKKDDNMKWGITEGSDYVKELKTEWNDGTQTIKVVLNKKLDNGDNTKTFKLKCSVGDSSTNHYKIKKSSSATDTVDDLTITIYSRPKLEYKSDRSLEYKGTSKGNSGTESVGSDSANVKIISDAKGVYIQALHDSSVIGKSDGYKAKGTSFTVDSKSVETMVYNMSDKFSGDKSTVNFRLCMYGKDNEDKADKWNSAIYGETGDIEVYKVVIKVVGSSAGSTKTDTNTSGGGVAMNTALPVAIISPAGDLVATATTTSAGKEYVYYGLKGQTIDVSKLGAFTSLKNANGKDAYSLKEIVVADNINDNTYTGVIGERAETDADGYDKVPKTGQSNVFVYIMVALIACAVCAGLYAYNKKAKNI